MYSTFPSFILGYHGCDQSVCEKILFGKEELHISKNSYDWLGNGVYFWENNPLRAFEYANILKNNSNRCNSKIEKPAVIGAIIDLGNCLNLLESNSLTLLRETHGILKKNYEEEGLELPQNKPIEKEKDLLLRNLDRAVVESTHIINETVLEKDPFDTVRGVFFEGEELYPNAGFKEKNHIQICVRNIQCIKGYFLPKEIIL